MLLTVLAAGLWWSSTQLNETERKLVGVWEEVPPNSPAALLFLPDRREVYTEKVGEKWAPPSKAVRWRASPAVLSFRLPPPSLSGQSLTQWLRDAFVWWNGASRFNSGIVRLTEDEFEYRVSGSKTRTLKRSHDPELLSLLKQLESGERRE